MAPGDVNMSAGVDVLSSPGKRFKKDDQARSPTKLDGRFGINTAGPQSASTAPAVFLAAAPPLPDPSLAIIMKSLADIALSNQTLETSESRLELKLEHHVTDLTDRLEAGLKLNRDETNEQICGLRKQMLELQAQQQKQQVDFTAQLAACTSSSSAPFDRAEMKKEIVQEVRGDSRVGAPIIQSGLFVQSASSFGNSVESEKFVPRRLFVKGFCNYGCEADEGISEANAKTAPNSILAHLKVDYQIILAENDGGILSPPFRNSQITWLLRDDAPDDAAWLILKDLKTVLERTPMHINQRPIFIQADAELWKKQLRAGLATASQAISDEYSNGGPGVEITKDWTSGTLWANKLDKTNKLGHWDRHRGWMWHEKAVKLLIPEGDLSVLEMSVNS
jgi:hypothetical protein